MADKIISITPGLLSSSNAGLIDLGITNAGESTPVSLIITNEIGSPLNVTIEPEDPDLYIINPKVIELFPKGREVVALEFRPPVGRVTRLNSLIKITVVI